ncbi:tetratricopeptide repeat protein [Archangium sp.]|uniref:tetratricopeptide repeat protein n=1 Tax=Archangium sp. TaxID=1872627 RepID=UPI002D566880|nr:tetratricopeptide repeat protein [Archangium sp.]HYO57593.1 tetratricopeptide repeat protein [Archangium sp.]
MNPPTTNWLPGLVVLAVGFIAAALFLLTQRRKGGAPEPRDGALEDLERRYQSLIEQLKELAADRHTLPPERYESERKRLELEAAAALRARDEHLKKRESRNEPGEPVPQAAPVSTGFLSPQLKGALWGGGIVLFFGTLGYTLVSEQRTRGEEDAATGRVPPGIGANAQQQQQEDPELAQAMERLRNNPSDLDAAALLSHELIRRQMYEEAERVTLRGLAVDPFSVELRVHKGVLRAVRGDEQGAEQELMKLVDTYPDAQEALLFLGAIAMRHDDKAKALDYFERFAIEVPSNMHPPPLLAAIQQLRTELGR